MSRDLICVCVCAHVCIQMNSNSQEEALRTATALFPVTGRGVMAGFVASFPTAHAMCPLPISPSVAHGFFPAGVPRLAFLAGGGAAWTGWQLATDLQHMVVLCNALRVLLDPRWLLPSPLGISSLGSPWSSGPPTPVSSEMPSCWVPRQEDPSMASSVTHHCVSW